MRTRRSIGHAQFAPDERSRREANTARPCQHFASTACATRTPISTPASSATVRRLRHEVDRPVAKVAERSQIAATIGSPAHADREEAGNPSATLAHRQRRSANPVRPEPKPAIRPPRAGSSASHATVVECGLLQSAPCRERVDAGKDDDAGEDQGERLGARSIGHAPKNANTTAVSSTGRANRQSMLPRAGTATCRRCGEVTRKRRRHRRLDRQRGEGGERRDEENSAVPTAPLSAPTPKAIGTHASSSISVGRGARQDFPSAPVPIALAPGPAQTSSRLAP